MKLTSEQVKNIVQKDNDRFKIIESIEGENIIYNKANPVIFKDTKTDKYYSLWWEEGLKSQEHNFPEQEAKEVKRVEEKMTLVRWIDV